MSAAPFYDAELADTLEAERLKRARRVRAACASTVPSLDPDEIAARVLHTLDELKLSASGGLAGPAGAPFRRRGKEAPPSPRTPTTLSVATDGNGRSRSPADHARGTESSPGHSGGRATENTTSNGGADGAR